MSRSPAFATSEANPSSPAAAESALMSSQEGVRRIEGFSREAKRVAESARETAEESFRKYEEALVQDQVVESVPQPEISMVPREVEEKVKEKAVTSTPDTSMPENAGNAPAEDEKKVEKVPKKTAIDPEVKHKMEARLASLARMYETKEIANDDNQSDVSDDEEER